MRGWTIVFVAAALVLPGAPAAAFLALPDGAEMRADGTIRMPLVGETPAWLTDDIRRATIAAGEHGLGFDAAQRTEVPLALGALFIRPGQFILSPLMCTTAFVFEDYPFYKISTAGHCVNVGETVIVAAWPSLLVAIGTVSLSYEDETHGDWALIDVAPQWQEFVDPSVAAIGGPSPLIYDGTPTLTAPRAIKHVGHAPTLPRAGVAYGVAGAFYKIEAAAAPGDSGSPVLTTDSHLLAGQALGIMTALITSTLPEEEPVFIEVSRVALVEGTIAEGDMSPAPPAH
ncbi:MAG TPA: hypothetical protein VI997_00170 [Candidatus Thermoplasmatota archaeon]|nr:hypothetical protein [Candidatus Thermoplasmatota archaeon]